MTQLSLDIAPRRIDITIDRLQETLAAMDETQRGALAGRPWWTIVETVQRLRAMERAELEVRPATIEAMANAYDRVVQPGEHAVQAMLLTFNAVYASKTEAA